MSEPSNSSLRILLVDGDKKTRAALAKALGEAGHECEELTDGTAALELCLSDAGEKLDCVLSEIRLEGTGGLELISRLKDRRPQLPLIALSGQSDSAKAIAAVQAGAFDSSVSRSTPRRFSRRSRMPWRPLAALRSRSRWAKPMLGKTTHWSERVGQ